MPGNTWYKLGDVANDVTGDLYYRGQRIREAYYRGEQIWGEEFLDILLARLPDKLHYPGKGGLLGIDITKLPDKSHYTTGEDFDYSGAVVMANYEDGSAIDITSQCAFVPVTKMFDSGFHSGITIPQPENEPIDYTGIKVLGVWTHGTEDITEKCEFFSARRNTYRQIDGVTWNHRRATSEQNSESLSHSVENFSAFNYGFASSTEYVYNTTADGTYHAIMYPRICVSSSGFMLLPYYYVKNGIYTYPNSLFAYNNSASESSIKAFNDKIDFLSKFWTDIERYSSFIFCGQITVGQGGMVTPANFFAAANEPRMFTATPDEHHAIHSVTAYNTLTNQQIPLQESGLDLLTGAKSYMFTMPAANVRIIVEFRSIEITIPVTVKYTSPRGKVFTTSFNLLYDDTEQREETAPPVEEQEGENQNE